MMPLLSAPELSCRELVRLITTTRGHALRPRPPPLRPPSARLRRLHHVEQMRQTIRLAGTLTEQDISPPRGRSLAA
jgi:hypothetical protein